MFTYKSNRGRRIFSIALAAAFAGWDLVTPALAIVDAPDIALMAEELKIRREAETQIQEVLDKTLGKGRAQVFVELELEILASKEEQLRVGMGISEKYKEKAAAGKSGGFQTQYILPGVPKPKTITQGQQAPAEKPESAQGQQAQQQKGIKEEKYSVQTIVKKLQVTVLHDDTLAKEKLEVARQGILEGFKSRLKLQDSQIKFKPLRWTGGGPTQQVRDPNVFLPLLFALLFFLLLLYLFGPLSSIMRSFVRTMRDRGATEVSVDSKFEGGPGGEAGAGGALGALEGALAKEGGKEEGMKKLQPFKYINPENMKRLIYLLRHEEPWVVAVVINYLSPDLARQILVALPLEGQAKVAIETATIRQVTREQVEAIDNDIQEKVDFLLGGIEPMIQMLDKTDLATRENILEYLKNEQPAVYQKVRKAILMFEDVAGFPDREMETIIRELKTESMAMALRDASPEILNKFLAGMSTGAAALLREAMEYGTRVTADQVDGARREILNKIQEMEAQGKVVVREKKESHALEGLEEEAAAAESRRRKWAKEAPSETSAAPGASPAEAASYLQAGVGYYEAGQYEASLPYFQQVLDLDPNQAETYQYMGGALYALGRVPEALAYYDRLLVMKPDPQLRSWVDSLKASTPQA